jgi:hypothetical protein
MFIDSASLTGCPREMPPEDVLAFLTHSSVAEPAKVEAR